MMFEHPPGGDGNDPNKPNELPTTPTLDRGSRSHKTPGAPKKPNSKRDRFALAEQNDADIDAIMGDMGKLNPSVPSDIISAFESTPQQDRGLFGDRPTQSASPSGFGFGVGMPEGRPMKRVASDPLIRGLGSLSIDESGYNTPVSSPSSSKSGSPPGAPRKRKEYPSSKGGMSRKSKKSRRFKKSRKPKKSKKTKKSKKNRKSRKSRKHK